jgi:hypothetical protein
VFAGSRHETQNPADAPESITRNLNLFLQFPADELIVTAGDSENEINQWFSFRFELEG